MSRERDDVYILNWNWEIKKKKLGWFEREYVACLFETLKTERDGSGFRRFFSFSFIFIYFILNYIFIYVLKEKTK